MDEQRAECGTHSTMFEKFYESNIRLTRKKYADPANAIRAKTAILNLMNRRHIFDVRMTRRKNVLYLENYGGIDYRKQIMDKFLRIN